VGFSRFRGGFGARGDRLTTGEAEELRRENAERRRTNEILELASAFFAQEADPTRRGWRGSCRRTGPPTGVAPLLTAIGEPVSTCDDHVRPGLSDRMWADARLCDRIWAIWEASRWSYGSPLVFSTRYPAARR
jgi:hypothetical protein